MPSKYLFLHQAPHHLRTGRSSIPYTSVCRVLAILYLTKKPERPKAFRFKLCRIRKMRTALLLLRERVLRVRGLAFFVAFPASEIGAAFDPFLEDLLLFFRQGFILGRRWHEIIVIGIEQGALQNRALGRVARDHHMDSGMLVNADSAPRSM